MFNLKRSSVIFAILGVLGLSILGGVLIRNKIIWDNWLSQQLHIYNQKVKNLENEINLLETNLDKNMKNKENLSKKINNQQENMKQFQKVIDKYGENIKKLESIDYSVSVKKSKVIEKAINKSTKLEEKILKTEFKKQFLSKKLLKFDNNGLVIEELIKKILDLNKTLQEQEEILEEYVTTRLKFSKFIKKSKEIYKQKLKQKQEIIKNKEENEILIKSIDTLISSLNVVIDNKKQKLEDLFLKNPIYYY